MSNNGEVFSDSPVSDAAESEIAALRAEMRAARLLPGLPECLEPTQESAEAMLARVLGPHSISIDETKVRRPKASQNLFALAASIAIAAAVIVPAVFRNSAADSVAVVAEVPLTDAQIAPRELAAPLNEESLNEESWARNTRFDSAEALPLEPGAYVVGEIPAVLASGIDLIANPIAAAAWTHRGGLLYVVTWGSSSCPMFAAPQAERLGENWNELAIDIAEPGDWFSAHPAADFVCTDDLSPTTTIVWVPPNADNEQLTTLQIGTLGTVTIAPRGIERGYPPGEPGPVAGLTR